MLGDQFQFLAWFYVNPRKAASAVLDQGQVLFALIVAALVTLAMSTGVESIKAKAYLQLLPDMMKSARATPPSADDRSADDFSDAMQGFETARRRIDTLYFAASFKSVVVMAVVFVPVSILLLAAFCHLGGGLTVLFRDYMPALVGLLFAWTAAFLPAALLWWSGLLPPQAFAAVQAASLLFFLALSAPVLSTVLGVGLGAAIAAAVAALAASVGASFFFANSGNLIYMFASPWVLYYGYQMFGRDLSSLGGGLSARQNFKRQLELATVNPRDADAHYQLGLLYVQRRAWAEAETRFRRALEIDPHEPETLFQLGRLLRQQGGRDTEARQLLEHGAQLDPKLASHQVWRELGAVALAGGDTATALHHLEHYVHVREYDPEGLVLYGQSLRALQRFPEARAAFQNAIEAVRTAPAFRRRELGHWERQARQGLKSI